MRELASSGRVKRSSFRKPQTLESCREVQNVATTLTTLVQKSPSSLDVPVQAARITASSGLICTPQEKVALSEIDDDFEEALTTIKSALRHVQEQLVTLTGSTASPEVIATIPHGVAKCPDNATGNKIRNNI